MTYQDNVAAAAVALQRGEDANWELARLTDENTNTQTDRTKVTMEQWCNDVRDVSGRRFSTETGRKYAAVWREHGKKLPRLPWTEAMYDVLPRERHEAVAERGAKFTAEKGDAQVAAEAVKIALDRPEVAALVVADAEANRAVTQARQRHDDEAAGLGESRDPDRRTARHNSEQRDVIYRLVKFRNWLFSTSDAIKEWEWTDDLRAELADAIAGVQGALEALGSVPDFDNELATLLKGNTQ